LVNSRIKLFDTWLTDTVAEFGLGMFADIFLQLLPESSVIANLFTGCTDRDKSSKDFDIP
jgi:hypothetical protein